MERGMTRYTTIKPKSWWHVEEGDPWEERDPTPLHTTICVHTDDPEPQETGLLDSTGAPLYRMSEKRKTGFIGT
jgi:hypothetical protein